MQGEHHYVYEPLPVQDVRRATAGRQSIWTLGCQDIHKKPAVSGDEGKSYEPFPNRCSDPAMTAKSHLFCAVLLCTYVLNARADKLLCVSDDGVFEPPTHCIAQENLDVSVQPAEVDRKFAYINRSQQEIRIGLIRANSTEIDLSSRPMMAFDIDLPASKRAPGVVTLKERALGTWTLKLDFWWFQEGRLNVSLMPGAYDLSVVVGQETLFDKKSWVFRQRAGVSKPPAEITLTGRAVSQDGVTSADFAEITADCKRVVCAADAQGVFHCRTARPASGSFCIEHPRFGRRRIELEGRSDTIPLGVVTLTEGATVTVVKPLHVALPDGTTATLLEGRESLQDPQSLDGREWVEFSGLSAGRYAVLIAGPAPLQKKRLPLEVANGAVVEVPISFESYRLEGRVELAGKPIPDATVSLQGEVWGTELRTNQSGRFDAELWAAEDYGVVVEAPGLSQPYLIMKHASMAESEWNLVIPSRRISGRVFDAETGKPIREATLVMKSDSGGTRASRSIDVDDEGKFDIPGIGEGQYELSAGADGFLPGESLNVAVQESAGDQHLDFPLLRGVSVVVNVVDASGTAVPGATVLTAFGPRGEVTELRHADDQGRVAIAVAENTEKTIFALPGGGSFATARVSARDSDVGARAVVPPRATLRLRARDTDGAPIAGLGVNLRYGGADLPSGLLATLARMQRASLATNAAGEMVLTLPVGSYLVSWKQAGRFAGSGWRPVELQPGETVLTETFAREKPDNSR